MPSNELNDKEEVFTVKLTEWQNNAIQQILLNSNITGRDAEGVFVLLTKLRNLKKE